MGPLTIAVAGMVVLGAAFVLVLIARPSVTEVKLGRAFCMDSASAGCSARDSSPYSPLSGWETSTTRGSL